MKKEKIHIAVVAVYAIQLLFAFVWLKSALEKLSSPKFVSTLGQTLTYFASKNPLLWYKNFLFSAAIPNAQFFGQLTQWGEFTAGLCSGVSALIGLNLLKLPNHHAVGFIGSILGAFLNLQFGLAAFWTSPANETLNLLMFTVQVILGLYHWKNMRTT